MSYVNIPWNVYAQYLFLCATYPIKPIQVEVLKLYIPTGIPQTLIFYFMLWPLYHLCLSRCGRFGLIVMSPMMTRKILCIPTHHNFALFLVMWRFYVYGASYPPRSHFASSRKVLLVFWRPHIWRLLLVLSFSISPMLQRICPLS
jgi:hypothetical protein